MDGSLDIQAAWPMPDDNFDFLGDFDEVAPLDLFGTIGPKDEAGSSGCNTAAAASQCSGDIDAPSQPVPTGLELRKDKLAAVKEINKRAQKRFRDKQKSKWQRLQEDFAASTAAVQRLQSENQHLTSQNSMLEQTALLHNSDHMRLPTSSQVTLRPNLSNSLGYSIWGNKAPMKCTVNHTDEMISMYQVARMPPQQLALLWQDYVRELGICLAIGGDALRGNIANANGQRMATLQAELCQLCTCKANIDLEAHRAFVASPLLPALHSSTSGGAADPDWLQLGQNLKLSEEQLKNLFLLRRAFLHRQALILGYQHDLQLGLQSGQQKQDAQLQALQYTHQMQDFAIQLHEAFMQFMGGLYTGILTVWQASMAVVSTFPHPPEKLKDIVDALAEHHGEPSAASLQVVAADRPSDSWAGLDTHIYKSKLMAPQFPISTAVASQ